MRILFALLACISLAAQLNIQGIVWSIYDNDIAQFRDLLRNRSLEDISQAEVCRIVYSLNVLDEGRSDFIQLLLRHKIPLAESMYWTVFRLIVVLNDQASVPVVLSHPTFLRGDHPSDLYSICSSTEMLECLLRHRVPITGNSTLFDWLKRGKTELFSRWLELELPVEKYYDSDISLIEMAISQGHASIVSNLLKEGYFRVLEEYRSGRRLDDLIVSLPAQKQDELLKTIMLYKFRELWAERLRPLCQFLHQNYPDALDVGRHLIVPFLLSLY